MVGSPPAAQPPIERGIQFTGFLHTPAPGLNLRAQFDRELGSLNCLCKESIQPQECVTLIGG
jgi:hypothetical protein